MLVCVPNFLTGLAPRAQHRRHVCAQVSVVCSVGDDLSGDVLRACVQVVVLFQVQKVEPLTATPDSVDVVISSLSSSRVEILPVLRKQVGVVTLTVGLIIMGKQHPTLAAGLPAVLSHRRFQVRRWGVCVQAAFLSLEMLCLLGTI